MTTSLAMRGLGALFVGMILVGSCAVAQPNTFTISPDNSSSVTSPYKSMRLENGLAVVVIEDRTVPLVTIDITVRNGGFTEPDEFAGLSHLYEHMFFKANAVLPSQEAFMQRVRQLGIVYNGYTSDEVVTYFFTLPKGNLEPGMKFMADAIRTPKFIEDELVKEREVVLGEFDRNEAQPEFALRYALDSAMWMPYVSRKQPLGQRHVIKTATVEKMKMIQNRFYIPNNSALIVSGDVDADKVFAMARTYLSDWQRGADPFPQYNPPAFPLLKSKLVVREAKVPNVLLRVLFHGPSVMKDEPSPYVAELLGTMMQQPTSRLYHKLVDSGLVLDMRTGYLPAHNTGEFVFYMTAPAEKAKQAIEVLKGELKVMKGTGYFSNEEIQIAKQIIADQKVFERENPFNFTIGTTAQWWSMASLDYYLFFPTNVQGVQPAMITDFVNRYLVAQPFALGVGAQQEVLDALNFTEEALQW